MEKHFMNLINEMIGDKISKTNDQRVAMALTICQIMTNELTPIQLKSAIAASMMDMLEDSMIPEDGPLVKALNEAIDSVMDEARRRGVSNLREKLNEARKEAAAKVKRMKDADNILNSLNLNDLNLN